MSIPGFRAAALLLAFILTTVTAGADDWVAQKLRGGVFTLTGGTWVAVHRGDVVPDGQMVRTQNNARVTLVRGAEVVEVGPSSQIEIVDKDGRRFTTVKQWYGTVEIEAEVRNVQHFAVVNLHLAAVVKGTRFTVKTNEAGASVDVSRGQVSVKDSLTSKTVEVPAGHSVTTSAEATLVMDGSPPAADPTSANLVANTAPGAIPAATADASDQDATPADTGNSRGNGNGNSNDTNGSGPGNNGIGNAYGHGNGNANGHNN